MIEPNVLQLNEVADYTSKLNLKNEFINTDKTLIGNESQPSCQTAVSSRFLPQDVTLKDLRLIRNYFGEHDKTMFEHLAYALLDSLIKHFEKGDQIIEYNGLQLCVRAAF